MNGLVLTPSGALTMDMAQGGCNAQGLQSFRWGILQLAYSWTNWSVWSYVGVPAQNITVRFGPWSMALGNTHYYGRLNLPNQQSKFLFQLSSTSIIYIQIKIDLQFHRCFTSPIFLHITVTKSKLAKINCTNIANLHNLNKIFLLTLREQLSHKLLNSSSVIVVIVIIVIVIVVVIVICMISRRNRKQRRQKRWCVIVEQNNNFN